MKDICEYIIRQGHKKIALLSGITSYIATQERLLGCHYAFSEHQVPEPTIIETDWETETAYDKTLELFSSGKSHPTAIIAFNDSLALGAMQAVNKLGMSVPKDVSIVGFDGLDQDRYSMPALTTVNTNIPLMAKLAARNLDFTIQHPEQPNNVRIIVPHEISYRDSVSPELS
jgi:LacI family transcriptional regulator